MIKVKLPGLLIVNAAGDNEEIIVLSGNKKVTLSHCFSHDVLVFLEGNVLISVAAEHKLKIVALLLTFRKSLADSLHLFVVVAEGTAASGEGSVV